MRTAFAEDCIVTASQLLTRSQEYRCIARTRTWRRCASAADNDDAAEAKEAAKKEGAKWKSLCAEPASADCAERQWLCRGQCAEHGGRETHDLREVRAFFLTT